MPDQATVTGVLLARLVVVDEYTVVDECHVAWPNFIVSIACSQSCVLLTSVDVHLAQGAMPVSVAYIVDEGYPTESQP